MRISDWSSDVCSSDLPVHRQRQSCGAAGLRGVRLHADRRLCHFAVRRPGRLKAMSEIVTQTSDGVLTITSNRPDKKNALTQAMYGAMAAALEAAETDAAVRAVLIDGVAQSEEQKSKL